MREEPIAYDLVVLQGGVNDAWFNAPLGEISDSFSYRDFDRSTFAGGLEAIICRAKEYFPDATICYLIMYKMPLAQWVQNGNSYEPVEGVRNMDAYIALQRQILEKWEIPYLDFYGDDAFNNDVFKVETTTYLNGDYVHMTSSGYDLIFRYIAAWLETLPLPERIVEETESESESESMGAPEESESESLSEPEEKSKTDTEPVATDHKSGVSKILPIAVMGGLLAAAIGAVALIGLKKRR
jgi:lysophospholipase L1-like esterase